MLHSLKVARAIRCNEYACAVGEHNDKLLRYEAKCLQMAAVQENSNPFTTKFKSAALKLAAWLDFFVPDQVMELLPRVCMYGLWDTITCTWMQLHCVVGVLEVQYFRKG